MPTLILIGITNILGMQILVPMGKEKIALYSKMAGAVADLILNAVLIPEFASAGAAVGTLAAEVVVLIIQFAYLKNSVRDIFQQVHYGMLLAAAILFFGIYGGVLFALKEEIVREAAGQIMNKVKALAKR